MRDDRGAAGVLTVVLAGVMALVVGVVLLFGAEEDDAAQAATASGVGAGLSDAVPAEFAPWVTRAGALCPQFPPALIAAQIEAESQWVAAARSPVGAQGPAQFMPGTWAGIGRDDDGNGVASPFDIGDAVMAQGRFDCQLVEAVRGVPGDVVKNALAAYNAGPGAVRRFGGIPPYPETQAYVPKIIALAARYAAAPPAGAPPGAPASARAQAVIDAAKSQLGVPYSWGGGTPAGPSRGFAQGAGTVGFDCSSLVQYAFANGAGIMLPRTADPQTRGGTPITREQLQPGDVIGFARSPGGTYFHIGIYIGNGQMIQAPSTGDVVKITTIFGSSYHEGLYWSPRRIL